MPLEPEVLTRASLFTPLDPRLGDNVMVWALSRERGVKELTNVLAYHEVKNGFLLVESKGGNYKREWLLDLTPAAQPPIPDAATLEQMLGYSEEEVEDIVAKLRVAPKWYRTTVSKVCDLISWIDHHL